MYPWQNWLDHVTSPSNTFTITDNGDNTFTIVPTGTVMQQGTPQDQDHWNNMENGILDAHAALMMLLNYARQNAWEIERGQVTLTNSLTFPFNNSITTVALQTVRETKDYIVVPELVSFVGNVGEIEVSDKLTNGFKISYTGSASQAVINYIVIGGYMK